jgi:hypothetical protein
MYRPKRPAFRGPRFVEISFNLDENLDGIEIELR